MKIIMQWKSRKKWIIVKDFKLDDENEKIYKKLLE